jgi:hypothetical protein
MLENKWEYRPLSLETDTAPGVDTARADLNGLGGEGWELAGFHPGSRSDRVVAWLKRRPPAPGDAP